MEQETTRRAFLAGATAATAGLLAAGAAQPAEGADEPPKQPEGDKQHQHENKEFPRDHPGPGGPVGSPTDRGKLVPGRRGAGEKPVPVEAPDLTKLFWEMKDGRKEFHLVAKHTRREFLPGAWMDVWGYNDSMPGPTIEVNQGDRVRI